MTGQKLSTVISMNLKLNKTADWITAQGVIPHHRVDRVGEL